MLKYARTWQRKRQSNESAIDRVHQKKWNRFPRVRYRAAGVLAAPCYVAGACASHVLVRQQVKVKRSVHGWLRWKSTGGSTARLRGSTGAPTFCFLGNAGRPVTSWEERPRERQREPA